MGLHKGALRDVWTGWVAADRMVGALLEEAVRVAQGRAGACEDQAEPIACP